MIDIMCDETTMPGSAYRLLSHGGHRQGTCSRKATYTNGKRCLCTQHAKVRATVLRKSMNRIQDGYRRIEKTGEPA